MKLLYLDIETSPNIGDVWSLWNANVSLNQLRESSYTLCVSALWDDEDESMFFRHDEVDFLDNVYDLLESCDSLVTYNGDQFDIPTLNKEFLLAGYVPPAPYNSIDLYKAVKKRFKFPSNKLQYVAQALGHGGKEQTGGHELWVRVMAGDEEAWIDMERYCRRDTEILKPVYGSLRPWISNHPNTLLRSTDDLHRCGRCNGEQLERRGYRETATAFYQRWQCADCGGWSQSTIREGGVKFKNV